MKKIFVSALLLAVMSANTYAAVETVSCDTDASFAANSCDQCFSGGEVSQGDYRGELNDVWENNSADAQLLYKEEQDMPQMISLGWASWAEGAAGDSVPFWQYTSDLEALYDEDNLGYKLDAGGSVKWLESSLGSAYQLTSAPANTGNAGLLTYDIAVHALESDGTISTEATKHRECVLYTAGEKPTTPPEPPKKLPETGAEHWLLAIVALMLGFGFLKARKK